MCYGTVAVAQQSHRFRPDLLDTDAAFSAFCTGHMIMIEFKLEIHRELVSLREGVFA